MYGDGVCKDENYKDDDEAVDIFESIQYFFNCKNGASFVLLSHNVKHVLVDIDKYEAQIYVILGLLRHVSVDELYITLSPDVTTSTLALMHTDPL